VEFRPFRFKETYARRPQIWILFQNELLFHCTLYIDSPGGSTDTVASHVSFVQVIILQNASVCQLTVLSSA